MAFSKACLKYEKAHHGLPFALMCFSTPLCLPYSAEYPDHTAYNLREASQRPGSWDTRHKSFQNSLDEERALWPIDDMPAGASHYIVVEGLTEGKVDEAPLQDLKAEFVQKLTTDFPSIAIETANGEWFQCPDYLARGLPVLLLDSRPPPRPRASYATNFDDMQKDLVELEARLVSEGMQNNCKCR